MPIVRCAKRSQLELEHLDYKERAKEVKGVQVEEIKESYLSGEEYEEDTCVLENSAWSERYGNNFDWKIFGVEENLL